MHRHLKFTFTALLAVLLTVAFTGCAVWSDEKGVVNHWRDPALPGFVVGQTNRDEVLERLGPPSQVLRVKDGLVFYYLHEQKTGKGYYFLLYNRRDDRVRYDRAIFFFSDEGVLQKHAYSLEKAAFAGD